MGIVMSSRVVTCGRAAALLSMVVLLGACGSAPTRQLSANGTGRAPAPQQPSPEPTTDSTDPSPSDPSTPVNTPTTIPRKADSGCPAPARRYKIPGTGKKVALTFDDGPSPTTTPQILAILADKGVHATFFDTGIAASKHPDLVRAEVDGGHVIGNHSWSHPQFTKLTDAAIADQINRTSQVITQASGRPVCYVRPPYGDVNGRVNRLIASLGYSQAMWNVDTLDWKRPGVDKIAAAAVAYPDNKMPIVLMHAGKADGYGGAPADGTVSPDRTQTVAALPMIIDTLKARGYTFVQLDGSEF